MRRPTVLFVLLEGLVRPATAVVQRAVPDSTVTRTASFDPQAVDPWLDVAHQRFIFRIR